MSKGIFITATGTDVGKTYVTALILKTIRKQNINAGYYKAALSGAEVVNGKLIPGDAKYVCDIANISENPSTLVSYIYKSAVSPHLASNIEGNPVEIDKVVKDFTDVLKKYEYICVEGSGGIICPLRIDNKNTIMLTDVIKKLNLNIIIIASARLGTINETVLTCEYAKSKGIKIKGIILNNYNQEDIMHQDNKEQIEYLTNVPIIACVKKDALDLDIEYQQLIKLFSEV